MGKKKHVNIATERRQWEQERQTLIAENARLRAALEVFADPVAFDLKYETILDPHAPGCKCPRASCLLARLTPLNDPVITEALEDVGL